MSFTLHETICYVCNYKSDNVSGSFPVSYTGGKGTFEYCSSLYTFIPTSITSWQQGSDLCSSNNAGGLLEINDWPEMMAFIAALTVWQEHLQTHTEYYIGKVDVHDEETDVNIENTGKDIQFLNCVII